AASDADGTFPLMLQVYSIRTRSRAVEIFTTCANLICAIEELEKGKFWGLRIWCSAYLSLSTRCWRTISLRAQWKIHEACMLALGSVKTIITENVKNGRIQFDMHGFLAGVILADLNLTAMSPELIQQFLQATVSGLHDSQPPSVRISAVRAIWGYCDQLKLSESTHILQPFLPSVLEGLVQLAAQFSSEVLTLVMETLCIVCTVDPAFTTSAENKICPLTIAIFLKYNNGASATSWTTLSVFFFSSDPVVAALAQDIFKELAQIEGCQGPMQMRLIPTLISIMQAPPDKIPSGLCANGGECLRAYVSVALEQIAQWRDEQGNSGLWYVMQVVNQLLDPRTSESTAVFVGRLVSTLISRAGTELGDQLDHILRAILSKMQQAEALSVMQVGRRDESYW
ncbi:Importin 9, partial [Goodea atripinnis]